LQIEHALQTVPCRGNIAVCHDPVESAKWRYTDRKWTAGSRRPTGAIGQNRSFNLSGNWP